MKDTSIRIIWALLLCGVLSACGGSALEQEIDRQRLEGGVIVYGYQGERPSVIEFGGKEQDVYPYWSLSKPIAAAVVMRIAEGDPDIFDEDVGPATVEQLLQHSGGWDQTIEPDNIGPDGNNCSDPALMPVRYRPGTRQTYSNLGYCALPFTWRSGWG